MQHLVEDHLREPVQRRQVRPYIDMKPEDVLELDGLPVLSDLLRNVLDLNDRVRLDDAEQVLFEERVVECREVCADCDVR